MEVPRYWRLKLYKGIEGETCDNCGHIDMLRRRPACPECGLVFKAEKTEETDNSRISTHLVIGKNMRMYFVKEKIEEGIPVEIPMRIEKEYVE